MFRFCPRNHSARATSQTPSFTLFKPLVAIASLTIMFELLPIDFQNYLAPALVTLRRCVLGSIGMLESPLAGGAELTGRPCIVDQGYHYTQIHRKRRCRARRKLCELFLRDLQAGCGGPFLQNFRLVFVPDADRAVVTAGSDPMAGCIAGERVNPVGMTGISFDGFAVRDRVPAGVLVRGDAEDVSLGGDNEAEDFIGEARRCCGPAWRLRRSRCATAGRHRWRRPACRRG